MCFRFCSITDSIPQEGDDVQKRLFFRNAAILTVTSLLLRSIGILFRIYVSNRIGAEGMGLYQLIVSVYVLAASFASSGLTTAVTRLCTDELAYERHYSARRILYISVLLSIAIGIVSGILIYGGADVIAVRFLHDSRAISSLRILTISLPFMGASSCIKGYFFARRKVTSSSVAQILEQLVRIVSILVILELRHVFTVEGACFTVLLGDTVAEATSCLFMTICYIIDRRLLKSNNREPCKHPIQQILHIALPITGGRYLSSGLRTAENILVPDTLYRFTASRETALAQFGMLKGMALPLIFFPSSFLTAFTSLLIPEISEAKALCHTKHLRRTVDRAIHLTLLSSYLISGIFLVLAYPLAELVYHDKEVGRMLLMLAPLAPIMYLESVVVGILKGLDQQTHSLLYSVVDSASRIVLILLFVPRYGIDGFYGVMVFSNLLTCIMNTARLRKVTDLHIPIGKWFVRPLIGLAVSCGVPLLLTKFSGLTPDDPVLYCVTSIVIISSLYIVLMPFLKCVEKNDFITVHTQKNRTVIH